LKVTSRYFYEAKLNKKKNTVQKSEALERNVLITDGRYVLYIDTINKSIII